jgi:UrcA family protein
MKHMQLKAAALAMTVTAIIIPSTVHAAEAPLIVEANLDRPVAYVGYADLNLRSSAGIAALNGRIERAATELCADGTRSLRAMMDGHACRAAAIGSASGQVRLALARMGNTRYAALSRIVVAGK